MDESKRVEHNKKELLKMFELRKVMDRDLIVVFHITAKHLTIMQARPVTRDDVLVEPDGDESGEVIWNTDAVKLDYLG